MFLPCYDVYCVYIAEQTTANYHLFVLYNKVYNFAKENLYCGEKVFARKKLLRN